jgi:hypothetical protein
MNTPTSTTHHLNTLIAFRQEVNQKVFLQRRDALFNTLDALLSADTWSSFAYLSQSERFARQRPSLYDALQDGRVDTEALHQLLVRHCLCTGQHLLASKTCNMSINLPVMWTEGASPSATRTRYWSGVQNLYPHRQ